MKLLFLTGSRGEWGYIRPILRLCQQRTDVDYSLCVTNMHLLPAYGYSVNEIRADGFEVVDEIFMALEGDNHFTMSKSLGLFMLSFVDVLRRQKPDWLILAGDRGEQLMGAIAGAYTYIPTAHIQAGELSGNIDGIARHALGKFAHLHFAANEDAARRLIQLGEEEFRVRMVGAPQVDELVHGQYSRPDHLAERYGLDATRPFLLVVQHPVTEEFDQASEQIAATAQALKSFEMPKVWILPNNDAGSHLIRQGIDRHRHGMVHTFANLPREDYLGLLRHCSAIVGNSSSGLLEAPSFQVPAVNIGNRQRDRVQGPNVINVPNEQEAIVEAIRQACSAEFRESLRGTENPYGDGRSSERILDILLNTPRDSRLLGKRLTY